MLNKANTVLKLLNFGSDFVKLGHDQYVYRHAIGYYFNSFVKIYVGF
jgi:hypothetical protein